MPWENLPREKVLLITSFFNIHLNYDFDLFNKVWSRRVKVTDTAGNSKSAKCLPSAKVPRRCRNCSEGVVVAYRKEEQAIQWVTLWLSVLFSVGISRGKEVRYSCRENQAHSCS